MSGPSTTSSRTYWERVAETRWGRYITELERAAVLDATRGVAPADRQVLDVGCDGGRWSRVLVDEGWSVTAIDVLDEAVRTCRERIPEARVQRVWPGATTLPCADGSLSLIICIEVADVIFSDWFAAEVVRCLRPGGRVVASTWNVASVRGAVSRAVTKLRGHGEHDVYHTSYARWRRAWVRTGLRVIAERGLCWFPFGRSSDSRLIPSAVALERLLRLDSLVSLSPWVVVTATKP